MPTDKAKSKSRYSPEPRVQPFQVLCSNALDLPCKETGFDTEDEARRAAASVWKTRKYERVLVIQNEGNKFKPLQMYGYRVYVPIPGEV